jgi:hypothetical protein
MAAYPTATVPIAFTGSTCARRDCTRPVWSDGLCGRCWRLGKLFGKDPWMFAYEPLNGYADERDAVALPWERLEREAAARGIGVADVLASSE